MAFRSVRMRLFNMTSNTLRKTEDHLDHGEYVDSFGLPETIVPDQLAEWQAESKDLSVLTGTEGNVDYQVDDRGDKIHLEWTNPAVGNTFFGYGRPFQADGSPSADFVFFTLHFFVPGVVDPDPGQDPPVFAGTQGDIGPDAGTGVILPFPSQEGLKPHAWFDIGIRNKREPVSLRRWLKAVGIDPSLGLRAFKLKKISLRQLVELPPENTG